MSSSLPACTLSRSKYWQLRLVYS